MENYSETIWQYIGCVQFDSWHQCTSSDFDLSECLSHQHNGVDTDHSADEYVEEERLSQVIDDLSEVDEIRFNPAPGPFYDLL